MVSAPFGTSQISVAAIGEAFGSADKRLHQHLRSEPPGPMARRKQRPSKRIWMRAQSRSLGLCRRPPCDLPDQEPYACPAVVLEDLSGALPRRRARKLVF